MGLQFLSNINMNKNELQNMKLQQSNVAPSNPVEGQMYYNTVDKIIYYYDGTEWAEVGAGSSSNISTRQTTLTCTLPDLEGYTINEALVIAENDYLELYPGATIYCTDEGSTSTSYIVGIRNSSDTTIICAYLINKYTGVIEDRDYPDY